MSNKDSSNKDFTLVNKTGMTIKEVYVAPSNGEGWGDNLLTTRGGLKDGKSFEFIFEPGGAHKYDISVTFDTGDELIMEANYLRDIWTMTLKYDAKNKIVNREIER